MIIININIYFLLHICIKLFVIVLHNCTLFVLFSVLYIVFLHKRIIIRQLLL